MRGLTYEELFYIVTVIGIGYHVMRWLLRISFKDTMQRDFVEDMATNHLPHIYDALRRMASHLNVDLPDDPQIIYRKKK